METRRTFLFAVGLLYPAMLGNLFYSVFNAFPSLLAGRKGWDLLLVGLILTHYVYDYVYTYLEGDKHYSRSRMLLDTLLVFFLYLSVTALLPTQNVFRVRVSEIVLLMAFAKLFCWVWELLVPRADRNYTALYVDLSFAASYLGVFIVGQLGAAFWYRVGLYLVLLFDIIIFWRWSWFERGYKKRRPRGVTETVS